MNKIASIKAVTASKQKRSEDKAKLLESTERAHREVRRRGRRKQMQGRLTATLIQKVIL